MSHCFYLVQYILLTGCSINNIVFIWFEYTIQALFGWLNKFRMFYLNMKPVED